LGDGGGGGGRHRGGGGVIFYLMTGNITVEKNNKIITPLVTTKINNEKQDGFQLSRPCKTIIHLGYTTRKNN
jgi:hypothetical protein